MPAPLVLSFFFFNDTATTEIYTLSLHDALPISAPAMIIGMLMARPRINSESWPLAAAATAITLSRLMTMSRSEEHTSELQSHLNLVCRLLLEKKKQT